MACTRHTEVEWKIRFYSGREDSQMRNGRDSTWKHCLFWAERCGHQPLKWPPMIPVFHIHTLMEFAPTLYQGGLGNQPYTAEMMAGPLQDNHTNEQRSSCVSSPNGTLRWLWPGSVAWLHPCERLRQNVPETEWDHKLLLLSRSICVICYTAIDN